MTATALIFAVFLTNPSPVCVLDEVDAPLDDANVERYCDLLRDMVAQTETRFIVITHNPITMAAWIGSSGSPWPSAASPSSSRSISKRRSASARRFDRDKGAQGFRPSAEADFHVDNQRLNRFRRILDTPGDRKYGAAGFGRGVPIRGPLFREGMNHV